jgi:hypothetical protein
LSIGEGAEHKAMVKALMKFLNEKGYRTVGASCEGYPQCELIDGKTADFIGKNAQGQLAIGEAKTHDNMVNDRERTVEQLRVLASQKAMFYPCAPKECMEELRQILKELDLLGKANVIPIQYGK